MIVNLWSQFSKQYKAQENQFSGEVQEYFLGNLALSLGQGTFSILIQNWNIDEQVSVFSKTIQVLFTKQNRLRFGDSRGDVTKKAVFIFKCLIYLYIFILF